MAKRVVRYPGRLSRLSFFTRLEMAELPKLLMPNEKVLGVISGFSNNGTVLLAVTSDRLLLVDKKWVRLSYEDVRYESINEVSFSQQAILSSARFYVMGRDIMFKSWYKEELRTLVQFVQGKMFELRPATKADTKKYGYSRQYNSVPEPKFEHTTELPTVSHMIDEEVSKIADVPKHISNRVARWQRAAKYVGGISQG